MERLKRSLTSNLDSERSSSTLSRSSSREWLDALEKELSPADQSSGGTNTNLSASSAALVDDNAVTTNLGVGDVLKRALNPNDQECESADNRKQSAAREANDTRKRRGGRRKSAFNIFSNKNIDSEKDATANEPKVKQLGCVWMVQDVRHSYADIIYRRRSSNFSANKNKNQDNGEGKKNRQIQRNSLRSSISSLCPSLRGSDVLNLPKECDIGEGMGKQDDDDDDDDDGVPPGGGEKNDTKHGTKNQCNENNGDSFSTLASIEAQMRTRYILNGGASSCILSCQLS